MEIIKSSLYFLEKRRWEEELQQIKMAPSPSSIKKKVDVRYSQTNLVTLFCLIRKGDPTHTTTGCGAHEDEKQLLTSIAGVLSEVSHISVICTIFENRRKGFTH